jgi:molybdopterin-synthase adenylyltransferase
VAVAERPRLKAITVHGGDGQVVIWPRALRRMYLDDPTGSVAALLGLLADGRHEVRALRGAMAAAGFEVAEEEIAGVLAALDDLGVLEDAAGDDALDHATQRRHQSNLRFYDLFARLDRTSASMHRRVERSHVLLLGAGGLGAGVLQSLVGLGVGEVTIVDCDVVETKNLARQFAYGLTAVGRPKVAAAHDWAVGYSPGTRVIPVYSRITDVASILDLGAQADLVVCAIDSPDDVHLMVNEACFALGVPYVVGGLSYSTLSYWSVEPGRTPCRQCLELHRIDELSTLPAALRADPVIEPARINRASGPVIQLVSGLVSMEVLRYLAGTEPPVAAATYQVIELADGMATSTAPWRRHQDCLFCPVMASAPVGARTAAAPRAGVAG